jgi:pimeloyl-ACP methyl ester carboxylesterase
MSEPRSLLSTVSRGPEGGAPVLLLHDRYQDETALTAAASQCGQDRRTICIRSARTQMSGTGILGYYWYIGPIDRPELSTFGDGLFQLERLLIEVTSENLKADILGFGEGGVVALCLGLAWPERIASVTAYDADLPKNIDAMPIEDRDLSGLRVRLAEGATGGARAAQRFERRGANVETVSSRMVG